MICANCQQDVPGPVFCRSCGARMAPASGTPHTASLGAGVAQAEQTLRRPPAPLGSPPRKPDPPRATKPRYVLVGALSGVLLVGGGALAWDRMGREDEKGPADTRVNDPVTPSGDAVSAQAQAQESASRPPSTVVPKATTPPQLEQIAFADPAGDVFVRNDPSRPSTNDLGDITAARVVPTGGGQGRIEVTIPSGMPNYVVNVYVNVNASPAPEYLVHGNFAAGRFDAIRVGDWIKGNEVADLASSYPSAAAQFPAIPAATGITLVIPFKFSRADLPRKTLALCIQSIQRNDWAGTGIDQYDYLGGAGDGATTGRHSWEKPVRVLE